MATEKVHRKKRRLNTYLAFVTVKLKRPDGSKKTFDRWCKFPREFTAVAGASFWVCETPKYAYSAEITRVVGAPDHLGDNYRGLEVDATIEPEKDTSGGEIRLIEMKLREHGWNELKKK